MRYDWAIPRLHSMCVYGKKFDGAHAFSCKIGGFVTQQHNEVRNITRKLLEEICKNIRKEPILLQLNGKHLGRGTNVNDEACLDISATKFWTPGKRVFLDVWVFDRSEL